MVSEGRQLSTVVEASQNNRALLVGLTGGIGSGKSTVARMLADKGAFVVDADALARQVLAPGSLALAEVREQFGDQVFYPDGSLNRGALGRVVFADESARARLEAITLPRISAAAQQRLAQARVGQVAVYDVPLLVEQRLAEQFDVVVVVEASAANRLARLDARGLSREEALARMANQASDAQRRAVADVVLDNSGTLAALQEQVDRLWERLQGISKP
ncbi:Dephospho-CoA kinase [Actinomyces bovis]|uniref:Dephospho-CoA kinase n=1 Tax=Actinomyces bovis TaxID=1658 RepID=A0ABY1VJV1_9ACTO|nr:dephospho-CoA kinase [Actinomyces bovis]SPT52384.1 Dephospho-CoA kinase [Actinomyces bovis]VEG53977.1 Dephospho-CoA kinase [Actinomyces israelii]